MKNILMFMLFTYSSLICVPIFAQKNIATEQKKTTKKEVLASLEGLNKEQKIEVLNYILRLSDRNLNKLITKNIKKISPQQQQMVLRYAKMPPPIGQIASRSNPTKKFKTTTTKTKNKSSNKLTTIKFESKTYHFGSIKQGEKIDFVYKFTNTGNKPLLISKARGSCGCTIPKWPHEPILPGESSEIKVQFNSKGKIGRQAKKITITANTRPAQTFLTLNGKVYADIKFKK